MGRTVETLNDALATVYIDTSKFGYVDVDDKGNVIRLEQLDEDLASIVWSDFVDDIIHKVINTWKTFEDVSKESMWLSNETRIICENRFAYVAISEYCGRTVISLVPIESDYYSLEDTRNDNLAIGFCNKIARKFEILLGDKEDDQLEAG